MDKSAQVLFRSGCLVSVTALVSAVVLYPRARWLFVLLVIGIALVVVSIRFAKGPTPQAVADDIECLLSGNYGGWDVDDYEHLNPRDPETRELWRKSMEIGGLPEGWVRLDEKKKDQLRDIVRNLRQRRAQSQA
jgi:hypothetical protein